MLRLSGCQLRGFCEQSERPSRSYVPKVAGQCPQKVQANEKSRVYYLSSAATKKVTVGRTNNIFKKDSAILSVPSDCCNKWIMCNKYPGHRRI